MIIPLSIETSDNLVEWPEKIRKKNTVTILDLTLDTPIVTIPILNSIGNVREYCCSSYSDSDSDSDRKKKEDK